MYSIQNDKDLNKVIRYNFNEIHDTQFDAIFLCRSDNWLPPHLDPYFNELVNLCGELFCEVLIEPNVKTPRDIEEYVERKQQIRKELQKNKDK